VFSEHPHLTLPNASTVLWRYIDLAKLISLLEHRALWFARLDTLGDPYEGLPTRPLIDQMWAISEDLPAAEQEKRRFIAEHNTYAMSTGRDLLFASCWHASPIESAPLWSIYGRLGEGIAIRTTFERLRASFLSDPPEVYGGMVTYVDFESFRPSTHNIFEWAILKRQSFQHEQEFRALVMDPRRDLPGLPVPVRLEELIEEVYVSPAALPWYAELIGALCSRYLLAAPVRHSRLLTHPRYLTERGGNTGAA